MEQRLEHLEKAVQRHDGQISALFGKVDKMNEHLTSIQRTLDQIKYMGVGAVVYFLATEFGLIAALKIVA